MLTALLKTSALALTLALAAPFAQAAPIPLALSGGPTNYSATFSSNKTAAGNFSDQFIFGLGGQGLINGSLIAIFSQANRASQQIVFNSANVNSLGFVSEPDDIDMGDVLRVSFLLDSLASGDLLLTVNGCAGACDGVQQRGSPISASYSGTLNVTRTVPEPGSLALALTSLVALGGVGVTARRRRL